MEEVNALKIRNHLGEVLDRLNQTGEPILISKGKQIKAVLVTPEDFQSRFLDVKAEEEKKHLFEAIKKLRKPRKKPLESTVLLRQLRGYDK